MSLLPSGLTSSSKALVPDTMSAASSYKRRSILFLFYWIKLHFATFEAVKLLFKSLVYHTFVLATMKSNQTSCFLMLKLLKLSSEYHYITTSFSVSNK